MLNFLGAFDSIKKDTELQKAGDLLSRGTTGLTEDDAKLAMVGAAQLANQYLLKGKLNTVQTQALGEGLFLIGKAGLRLFGGLFKRKK